MPASITEDRREIPVHGDYDVVVCGAGPAGVAAALSAARHGVSVCLLESQGCLGGVWTSGLLSYILDARGKPGLVGEIRRRLRERGALAEERDLYDAEEMKLLLEEMCGESGVTVRLYARLVGCRLYGRSVSHAIFEAKEGRFAIGGRCFIDTTGDGDLGNFAGCRFDLGRNSDHLTQPMTLMALVSNVPETIRANPYPTKLGASCVNKADFRRWLVEAGVTPSYSMPSIFALPNGLCAIMVNHAYEKSGLDSRDLTQATVETRREVHRVVAAMRTFGPEWARVRLVATASQIGVREGRRIRGLETVSMDDLVSGRRYPNAVAHVTFPIDVHSIRKEDGGGYGSDHIVSKPYDIPLGALIARDVENLFLAGRCISGDFYAHASYRVTGNAVATGEAAGRSAAYAAAHDCSAHELDYGCIRAWEPIPGAENLRVAAI